MERGGRLAEPATAMQLSHSSSSPTGASRYGYVRLLVRANYGAANARRERERLFGGHDRSRVLRYSTGHLHLCMRRGGNGGPWTSGHGHRPHTMVCRQRPGGPHPTAFLRTARATYGRRSMFLNASNQFVFYPDNYYHYYLIVRAVLCVVCGGTIYVWGEAQRIT